MNAACKSYSSVYTSFIAKPGAMNIRLRLFTVCFLILLSSITRAQYVTVPDSNFGKWLNTNGFSACLQGNSTIGWQLDTACPAVLHTTKMLCGFASIHNLAGIAYFKSLDSFFFDNNNLDTLPLLPNTIRILSCTSNHLKYITSLPDSMVLFSCYNNLLTSLPPFPPTMNSCECSLNHLVSLPALPAALSYLDCCANRLTSLPALPAALVTLRCYYNQLSTLPTLPTSLSNLYCYNNVLTSLPVLPASMSEIQCNDNQISTMSALPDGLSIFNCRNNLLSSIPSPLPSNMYSLICDSNHLSGLPALPNSLRILECNNNQLTSLPELPDVLNHLYCSSNPYLTCFPRLKYINTLMFDSGTIQCLPDYGNVYSSYPELYTIPLCDIFNTNGCALYWNINGKAYFDKNNNCVFDSSDVAQMNLQVGLYNNGLLQQQTNTLHNGAYAFKTDTFDNYEEHLDTSDIPFTVLCPLNDVNYDTITSLNLYHYDRDFALICKQGFDVGVQSVSGVFMPGTVSEALIHAGDIANFYGVQCATGQSGTVTVSFTGPATYISPAPGALTPGSVTGNTVSWSVPDFGTTNLDSSFNILIQVDTIAQLGQQICFHVSVTPLAGDNNPTNNIMDQCIYLHSSFDPNYKEVSPAASIDTGQKWLTYTIHFQNTGNASARQIYVDDTLDNNLDASAIKLLAYSFPTTMQTFGNVVRFSFANINLPDSGTDLAGSQGYVQFKIKLKDNLPVGSQIRNTAYIYFDFNSAVATNTTLNTIAVSTGLINATNTVSDIHLYPNPAKTSVSIEISEALIGSAMSITDLTGRTFERIQLLTTKQPIDISGFAAGVYFVQISGPNGLSEVKKLVID